MNLISALVALSSLSVAFAAFAYGPATVHNSHPNMCYNEDKNSYYRPGDSWQLEGCGKAACVKMNYTDESQLMVTYESCGVMAVDPPCYLSENNKAAYPDCCPQPVCPDSFPESERENEMENEIGNEVGNEVEEQVVPRGRYASREEEREDFDYGWKGFPFDDSLFQEPEPENPVDFQSLEFFNRIGRRVSPRFHFATDEWQWY